MKPVKQGEILVKEGEKSDTIFILISGRLGVFKGTLKVTEFDEKGMILGEMSAIIGERRTATIKALEDTVVIELEADIDKLIKYYPEVAKKIMMSLATRLKKTTDEYWILASDLNSQQISDIKLKNPD